MCPRRTSASFIDVMGYTTPRYHEGKDCYVDFYCTDPETGKKRRKKYFITATSKRQRRAEADALIIRISAKLRQGWSPFIGDTTNRGNVKFDEILDAYLRYIGKTLRPKTIKDYSSHVKILRQYMNLMQFPCFYALHFDRTFISDFLEWLTRERDVSPRTYNNYRGWLYSLSEYMLERNYISENPILHIKKLKNPKKSRKALTEPMLRQLFSHLRKNDPPYLLAVMMEYYTFIRPNELRHIKIRDISFSEMSVFIPAEISKNQRNGKVAINESIIRLMIELEIHKHDPDEYLFGPHFLPAPKQAPANIFNKYFANLRKQLKWPVEIKFYSLKDSGIRDLSESVGIVTARDQARHTDISTTNKYLEGRDLKAPEAPKHFTGSLR